MHIHVSVFARIIISLGRCAAASAAFVFCLGLTGISSLGERPYTPRVGDPLRENWRWRTFADMNGLDAQCVGEGADGTLWFGTMDGLSSYDGFEWRRHLATDGGAIAGWVSGMCIDTDDTLTVCGWWGVSNYRDGKWTRLVPAPGVRFADVRRIVRASDGSLWAATSWGALRRHNGRWLFYTTPANAARLKNDERYSSIDVVLLPENLLARPRSSAHPTNRADLYDVASDAAGRVWFGTKGGEVLCYQSPTPNSGPNGSSEPPAEWTLYNEADGLPSGRTANLLPLRDGRVCAVVAPTQNLAVFEQGVWQTFPIPAPGIAVDGCRLLQTRDGVVWISARYVLFAWRGDSWDTYAPPQVPLPQALNLILQSRDGALWISGPNTDTRRIDYQTPRWFTLHDLNFQCDGANNSEWYLHRDGRAVRREAEEWKSFGVEDGLMDTPVLLLRTRAGVVWAAGSHEGVAATARLEGQRWIKETHPAVAWGIDWRSGFEASDGSLWFGAAVDSSGPPQHRHGLLQFSQGKWIHHHQPGRSPHPDGREETATLLPPNHRPEPVEKFSSIGESRDGRIWSGRNVLAYHDGSKWTEILSISDMPVGIIETMLTTMERDLWIGTRQYGAFRYDGAKWQRFQGKGKLLANSVRSLTQTPDQSIWAVTDRGFSRFDGTTWMDHAIPEQLGLPHEGGALKASVSGTLFINRHTVNWNQRGWTKATQPTPESPFSVVAHRFSGIPPRTHITSGAERISQPGNVSILWTGVAPLRNPVDVRLQFSYRLDDQPWSPFTYEGGQTFFMLPSGPHRFEVRARDQDFNIDPTPATLDFVVLPPVWRQTWFIALMVFLGLLLAMQTFRVLLEKRRLQAAHDKLEERVKQRTAQLEHANRELESFSYSVSHDLRAPLRSIDGFSRALVEDYDEKLDENGRDDLHRIRAAAQRMDHLIDSMLELSRVSRGPLRFGAVNLSTIAREIAAECAHTDPAHKVSIEIAPDVIVAGDAALLRNVLQNLFGNAWKFTRKAAHPKIEFGVGERDGEKIYFVRDNGAGFDRASARNLFGAFQRFHNPKDFTGTGIGLATVQRVIHRHGGRVEAESQPGEGAMFYFTLPAVDRSE